MSCKYTITRCHSLLAMQIFQQVPCIYIMEGCCHLQKKTHSKIVQKRKLNFQEGNCKEFQIGIQSATRTKARAGCFLTLSRNSISFLYQGIGLTCFNMFKKACTQILGNASEALMYYCLILLTCSVRVKIFQYPPCSPSNDIR